MTSSMRAPGATVASPPSWATSAAATVTRIFALSWSLWAAAILLEASPLAMPLRAAGTFGPAAVVLTARRRRGGRPALLDAIRMHVRFHGTATTTALAVALPPSLVGLAVSVDMAFGGSATPAWPPLGAWPLIVVYVLALGGPLGEELAWRGHLLPCLETRHGPVVATLLVGAVWTLWHLPLFLMDGTVQSEVPLLLFAWQIIATSFLYTWLQHRTPHSLVSALALHTSFNTSVGIALIGPDGPHLRAMLIALVLATVAGTVVASTNAFRRRPSADTPTVNGHGARGRPTT